MFDAFPRPGKSVHKPARLPYSPPMDIRLATETDATAISALLVSLTREHLPANCTADGLERLLATMTPAAIRERMAGDYVHWIAVHEESVVGVCALREKKHLYHLFVANAFQRQSVGRRLVDVAIAHCRSHSPPTDVLTVNASSFGIPAYQRMGFVPDGEPQDSQGIRYQPMKLALRP